MKKEERADNSVYWDCDNHEYELAISQYLRGANEQEEEDTRSWMSGFWEIIAPALPNKDIAEELSDKLLKYVKQ